MRFHDAEISRTGKLRILPTHYFHVVFTLPSQLRLLAKVNPQKVYGLMFKATAQTLLELDRDPKRLGAKLGLTCVLHTWSRMLAYHPHVHCVITGGGLSPEHDRWIASSRKYLFLLKVMATLLRGKMLAGLRRLHRRGELRLPDELLVIATAFDEVLDELYRTDWVLYSKPPFGGAEQVYAYLGRYTHRVGLSNSRLRSIDDQHVRFVGRDRKLVTLTHDELLRRLLQHVLPRDVVKLRHYGLLAPSHATTLLEVTRAHLGDRAPPAATDDFSWRERLLRLTGIDLRVCQRCSQPTVERRVRLPPLSFDMGGPESIDSS